MTLNTWRSPFLGGITFSTRSVKVSIPTLSLFCVAEKAITEQISAAISLFIESTVPNRCDIDTSRSIIIVNSLSSTNFFMYGCPIRAVTFQSIDLISSPGRYSRTSSNSIPTPLNTLWYCPANTLVTLREVVIWILLIFRIISLGIIMAYGTSTSSNIFFIMSSAVFSSASAS